MTQSRDDGTHRTTVWIEISVEVDRPLLLDDLLSEIAAALELPVGVIDARAAAWEGSPACGLLVLLGLPAEAMDGLPLCERLVSPGGYALEAHAYEALPELRQAAWQAIVAGEGVRVLEGGWLAPVAYLALEEKRAARQAARPRPPAAPRWTWHRLGRELERSNPDLWEGVDWLAAADAYREALLTRHGATRILGQATLTPVSECTVALEASLAPEHAQRTRGDRYVRFAPIAAPAALPFSVQTYEDAAAGMRLLLAQKRRIVVVGRPGSGRSTLLKRLVMEGVDGPLDFVPIYVDLAVWAESAEDLDEAELFRAIAAQFEVCEVPEPAALAHRLLESERTLVLFDGLDEFALPPRDQHRALNAVQQFILSHPKCAYVVADRAVTAARALPETYTVEVIGLTPAGQHAFVSRWFRFERELGDHFWVAFTADAYYALRELCRLPLFLALACLAFEATGIVPKGVDHLFALGIQGLLTQLWNDALRTPWNAPLRNLEEIEALFSRLAMYFYDEGRITLPEGELALWFREALDPLRPPLAQAPTDGLSALQAAQFELGLLIEAEPGMIRMAHPQVQAHLAARTLSHPMRPRSPERLLAAIGNPALHDAIGFGVDRLGIRHSEFYERVLAHLTDRLQGARPLRSLIAWVERKAGDASDPTRRPALRAAYTWLALAYELAHRPEREIGRTLDWAARLNHLLSPQAPTLALALTTEFARLPIVYLDQAVAAAHSLDRGFALDMLLCLEIDLARDLAHHSDNDIAREVRQALDRLHGMALRTAQSIEPDLCPVLAQMQVPEARISRQAWRDLAQHLQEQATRVRAVGRRWYLTEDIEIADYLRITALLVECLLADSPEKAIPWLQRILLPRT